jgi:hypothetical protein
MFYYKEFFDNLKEMLENYLDEIPKTDIIIGNNAFTKSYGLYGLECIFL